LKGAPALPENIRQVCKGLPGTNTPAYHENSKITALKSFIGLAPGLLGKPFKGLYD